MSELKRYTLDCYPYHEYYEADDVDTELTRLRGEVERLTADLEGKDAWWKRTYENDRAALVRRAETAEARVKELEKAVVRTNIDNDQCFGILQGTEAKLQEAEARVKELGAEVEKLKGLQSVVMEVRDMWENIASEHAETINTLHAQLAELRARVRPGVNVLIYLQHKGRELYYSDKSSGDLATDIAKTIHDILPPVPKVLSEIHNMLEHIVPTVDPQENVDCHEMFQAVVSRVGIVKNKVEEAMGGEE